MARKKKHEKEANHERWLVSYGDLLTLLFAVFVVLYAMSQTDKKKAEEVAASLRDSFGMIDSRGGASPKPAVIDSGKTSVIPEIINQTHKQPSQTAKTIGRKSQANEEDFRSIKASIEAYLLKSGSAGMVKVDISRRGLVVSLKEAGFFASGSAVMKKEASGVIDTIAKLLGNYSNRCRVEGHTDNIPIQTGEFQSNWDLSTARATFLVKRLTQQYDLDPTTISAVGYGEYQPVADNGTAEGRAKNRRVDIVLLSHTSESAEPHNTPTQSGL